MKPIIQTFHNFNKTVPFVLWVALAILYPAPKAQDSVSTDSLFEDTNVVSIDSALKVDTSEVSRESTRQDTLVQNPTKNNSADSSADSNSVSGTPQDSLLWLSSQKADSLFRPSKDSIGSKSASTSDDSLEKKDSTVSEKQDSSTVVAPAASLKSNVTEVPKTPVDSSESSKSKATEIERAKSKKEAKKEKRKETAAPIAKTVKKEVVLKDTLTKIEPVKPSRNSTVAKKETTRQQESKAPKTDSNNISKKNTDTIESGDTVVARSISPPLNIQEGSIAAKDSAKTNEKDVLSQIKNKISQDVPTLPWKLSVGQIIWSILTFVMGFLVIRYITKIFNLLAENWAAYRIQIKGMLPVFRISGWAVILYIIIAGILHPPFETVLAMTASLGIAVGFASQDIFKNIFGGVVILMDRPFTVGDKIEIGKYYGEVTSIGIRTTRLQTADDSLIAIPNSELMNSSLSNSNSGAHDCQVVAEFYLPLDVDLAKIRSMGIKSAGISRYIYLKKPIAVVFKNEIHQGKSLLKMRLKAYVFDHRYEPAFSSEMTEIFLSQLKQHQVWGIAANQH